MIKTKKYTYLRDTDLLCSKLLASLAWGGGQEITFDRSHNWDSFVCVQD